MSNLIVDNRKARYNYQIDQTFEAGIVLAGWEIKSLRAGRAQLSESHVVIRKGEAFLMNAHISPLSTVSTHIQPVPDRSRKLLLNRRELDRLIGSVERKGYTLVPLNLHWKKNKVKVEIALAKGKKLHDKRQTEKDRDWKKQKQKLIRSR
jgi:SsrA-binding protein